MKTWRILGAAVVAMLLPLSNRVAEAQVVGPSTYSFTAGSQSNTWACTGGQSSFQVSVPSGLTGTFTVTVSQSSAGTYANPPWSYAPGTASYVNTITNSGTLTVNLGSNGYVKVADTSYSSGSATVSGVCSPAVAVIPPQTQNPGGLSAPNPTSGSTFYFAGDSITYGLGINNQTTYGCSHYAYPSPCFADQVSNYFSATEVNQGQPGSCLESTTTTGSLCNPASETPLITSYTTSLLPYAGNNKNWFWIQIGTNDAGCSVTCFTETGPDTQINVATYKSDLGTIVAALEAAGTPPNQIVLSEIPALGSGYTANLSILLAFNSAIASTALQYGTRYSQVYRSIAQCVPSSGNNPCLTDQVHPNNTGSTNIASADEVAAQAMGLSGQAASVGTGILNYGLAAFVKNPYPSQFNVSTLDVTGNTSSLYGPVGQYNIMNLGTATSGSLNAINFGTGPSSVAGVMGNCFQVYPNAGGPSGGVDFTANCASGDFGVAGNLKAINSVVAGQSTAATPTNGDGSFSRSTTSGAVEIGGSSSSCTLDYGVTTSSVLTIPCSPAMSGANITSNTLPYGAVSSSACTAWTPSDVSGASLSVTVNNACYIKMGKMVYMTMDITYPTTASASAAEISVPVTPASSNQALVLGYNSAASSFRPTIAGAAGAFMVFYANVSSGSGLPNSTFSTFRFVVSGTYISS